MCEDETRQIDNNIEQIDVQTHTVQLGATTISSDTNVVIVHIGVQCDN